MARMARLLAFLVAFAALAAGADPRPNIIWILADDLGYSDLGCYGGEIQTPNLDRLAENGLRFTDFYNASRCCPTRASLMTGLYPTQAGVGRMTFPRPEPGYRGELRRDFPTVAETLRRAGYRAAMVGKWHLSLTENAPENALWVSHRLDLGSFSDPTSYPVGRGFEEHWGNIWGVVDFFDPFSLVHNTTPEPAPEPGFYYTDAINERAADFVRKYGAGDEPFFLYVAHTAPHWPLQALPEDIRKYEKRYQSGWDVIRRERYERLQRIGLLEGDVAPLPERHENDLAWEDNPDREWDAHAMAVHAAMVDRLDRGIVRILEALDDIGERDNTLIVFLSDNGASPEEPQHFLPGFDRPSHTRDGKPIRYTTRKRVRPGPQATYAGIGPRWANVANTPFRYWKKEQYEGGVATPLIAHWPAGIDAKAGSFVRTPGHVIDLVATAYDLGQIRETPAVEGLSLKPLFDGGSLDDDRPLFFEHFGARAVRQGRWKLVALAGEPWELYDLSEDRTETHDRAEDLPGKVEELAALWEEWAHRAAVFPAP